MRSLRKVTALLACISLIVSMLASCGLEGIIPGFAAPDEGDSYAEIKQTVTVSVIDGENYNVTSDNPVRVVRGGSVSFTVEIDEGYEYVSCTGGAVYSDGTVTVSDARYPTTVELKIEKKSAPVGGHTHSGGAASCTAAAVCDGCGKSYGEPLGHSFDGAPLYDTGHHRYECEREGCDELSESEAHFGGEATCTAPAVCEVCGGQYGLLAEHEISEELSFDEYSHWYGCTDPDCDERRELAAHTGGEATVTELALCEICDTPYGDYADEPPHEHIGGEATCVALAVCEDCGKPYGEALGHDYSETVSYDDDYHWYECEREGCDSVTGKTPHTGGEATYLERAVCEICGTHYGELAAPPEFVTVVLEAPEPREGYRFICWTVDIPAEEGGELLTEEESGSFRIRFGGEPVANFVDVGHHVVLYRTNGGMTADGKDYYYQTFSNEHYSMPNTIHQNGSFVRDGYILMRYTENSDGTGDYTTLGGKIMPNGNGFKELWLKWERITEDGFVYSIFTNGSGEEALCIQSYTGDADSVVIPDKVQIDVGNGIQTLTVEKIAAGAFAGKGMRSLVLPSSIVTVEDGAFSNCAQLTELTLHDNVTYIKDAAFAGCSSLATYYLNAGRLPVFNGGNGTDALFAIKYERLRMATERGEKKIVLISGSSSLYGFVARQMQEAFNNEYTVINYGTNASANSMLYMDAFMRYFGEGDIIIQAPETVNGKQVGDNTLELRSIRGCEYMYEIFSYVDMTKYVGFLNSLYDLNVARGTHEGRSYESWVDFIDEYGDMTTNKDAPNYQTVSPGAANPFGANIATEARAARFNALYARIKAQGAELYMSWAPVNKAYLNSTALSESTQKAFVEKWQSVLDYKIISDVSTFILEQHYMNGADYHPGVTGAGIRTERLIADLKAQLISEGKWSEQ